MLIKTNPKVPQLRTILRDNNHIRIVRAVAGGGVPSICNLVRRLRAVRSIAGAADTTRRTLKQAPPEPYYDKYGITIYLGDCMDILPHLKKKSVHVIIVDPPYGQGWISYRREGTFRLIEGDDGSFDTKTALLAALPILRPNRQIYVFGQHDLGGLPLAKQTEIIWDKGHFGLGGPASPWGKRHEYIQFSVRVPSKKDRERGGGRGVVRLKRGTVLKYPRVPPSKQTHPAEKPVDLVRDLIEGSTHRGETVLDFAGGTGSVFVAAMLEGRRAIGIEKDRVPSASVHDAPMLSAYPPIRLRVRSRGGVRVPIFEAGTASRRVARS